MSCKTPGCRDGGAGRLCRVTAAPLPQAVPRAGAHLLRLESLQLGCYCHLLCWEKVFSLPPPRTDLLSPGLGWRVGSPSASSSEYLTRRRRSQQSRWEAEVCCFPEDLLKGACSRTWHPGDSALCARHHSWRLLLPLTSCCQSLPHGDEQAKPCPATGCQSCSHPCRSAAPAALAERVAAALGGGN